MKKISIVVPIYNVSPYLTDCLDSLQCQTYENIEIIGIDDASTDNSADIYATYLSDKRFKLISNYENQGLPSARNLGILNAVGDYIFFVDSDDWVSPNAVEHLLDIAINHNVDIVIGGVSKFMECNGKLTTQINHSKVMSCERSNVNIHMHPELLNSVTSWNKLINTLFIKTKGLIFKPVPRRYEDVLTYKWYLSGATISNTSIITYYYRLRDLSNTCKSIMQESSIDSLTDRILSLADIFQFTMDKGFLFSNVDPLHSKYAMTYLPRALSWIIPKAFSIHSRDVNALVNFIVALKFLFSKFDNNYLKFLEDKVFFDVTSIHNNDVIFCFEYFNSIYKLT